MRLDAYLAENFGISRTRARRYIEEGRVKINGIAAEKQSAEVKAGDNISLADEGAFASRGGDKLEKALSDFRADVSGAVCVDIGASNGGFTDCLLRRGAAKVYAVDVGECALPDRLKNDPKVRVKDRLNARYMTKEDIGEECDVVTVDVSFISLRLILPSAAAVLRDGGTVYALIKPQFEAGKSALSKRGIVISEKIRKAVIDDIADFARSAGLIAEGVSVAPIRKGKNVEYVMMLKKGK